MCADPNGRPAMRRLSLLPVPDPSLEDDGEAFSLATLRVNAEAIYGRGIVASFMGQIAFDLQTYGDRAERALDLRPTAPAWGVAQAPAPRRRWLPN